MTETHRGWSPVEIVDCKMRAGRDRAPTHAPRWHLRRRAGRRVNPDLQRFGGSVMDSIPVTLLSGRSGTGSKSSTIPPEAVSLTVCIAANAIDYPTGGGHLWVYLNWAFGLRAAGCRVTWLEVLHRTISPVKAARRLTALEEKLAPFGLDSRI